MIGAKIETIDGNARNGNGKHEAHISSLDQHETFIIAGEAMQRVSYEIVRLARIDFDVLIVGETGVGKDLAAMEIHKRSARCNKPFIAIPLRSLSETLIESELFGHERGAFSGADHARIGKLEAADGGSVYIPEISSLTEDMQLKLLQFMQYKTIARVGQDARMPEKQLNVRVLLASNENLEELVRQGKMREDFYHRLSGVKLHIPPLRERIETVELLANDFLMKNSRSLDEERFTIHPDAIAALKTYHWPGNVRELRNVMVSALVHAKGPTLTIQDFPHLLRCLGPSSVCVECFATKFPVVTDFKTAEREFKFAYFHEVLKRANNSQVVAAKMAGMTPQGFRKAIRSIRSNTELTSA